MEQNHYQQSLKFFSDALYCEEENCEWLETEQAEEEEKQSICCNNNNNSKTPFLLIFEQDFSCGDEELSNLLSKEEEKGQNGRGEKLSFLGEKARYEAIEWILRVVSHYSFSALTAILAVNYLDRFLLSFEKNLIDDNGEEDEKKKKKQPWMSQLVAVTCLSLAAKVEEIHVPLLLDLQVEECKYMFEAKTIQRMELLVLSTLQWRMNPITPLSFIDYITRRLRLKNYLSWEFVRRCENLLLAIISDCRFVCYLPSVMATAIMLHVVNNIQPCTSVDFQDQILAILGIDKEKVERCCRLVKEVASTIQFYSSNKRKYASLPGSPQGVMDVSFSSSDSSSEYSWPISPQSSPEPLSKKTKH